MTERGCALNLQQKGKRLKPELSYVNTHSDLASDKPAQRQDVSENADKNSDKAFKPISVKENTQRSKSATSEEQTEFEINLNDSW